MISCWLQTISEFCLPLKQTLGPSFIIWSWFLWNCAEYLSLWTCNFLPFLISFPHGWDSFTIQFAECHKEEPRRDETIPSPKSNKIVTHFSYPAHIFQTNSPGGNWHPRPRYLETELGAKKTQEDMRSIKNHLQGHRKAP